MKFKKPILRDMLVLDPYALSAPSLRALSTSYDSLSILELSPVSRIRADACRASIDDAVGSALGVGQTIDPIRDLLANEPLLTGVLPDETEDASFEQQQRQS